VGTALVLGGGGVTGIAWELGLLDAWHRGGIDARTADVVIGTSAGSAVAAQLGSDEPLDALVARQLEAASKEVLPEMDLDAVIAIFQQAAEGGLTAQERCAKVGALALAAPTVSEAVRREIVAARLPSTRWPDRPLRITAVDAESGAFVAFDGTSGVDLVDAVAASCAVPGVWPPVTIGDRRYIDGGVRSPTNAFLAEGHERVVVLSPLDPTMTPDVERELDRLREGGAEVLLVAADEEALAAIGPNPLDPAKRSVAVEAGRRQGDATVAVARPVWGP
jgi:NTE family protein